MLYNLEEEEFNFTLLIVCLKYACEWRLWKYKFVIWIIIDVVAKFKVNLPDILQLQAAAIYGMTDHFF